MTDNVLSLPVAEYFDQLDTHKLNIESYFMRSREWNTVKKYLVAPLSPFESFLVQASIYDFQWVGIEELFLFPDKASRKYHYTNSFTAKSELEFIDKAKPEESLTIEHQFELRCNYWFDIDDQDGPGPIIELLDENRKLLNDLNESIFSFYKLKNIYQDSFELDGKDLAERFRQALYNTRIPLTIAPNYTWDEIKFCLQRVKFSFGNMHLYHPYLDNLTWHVDNFYGYPLYKGRTTLYDERYFIYCEITYQSLYHFWDRIGDILAEVIPTDLKKTSVDFTRVIDAISANLALNQNQHFQWLSNFRFTDYKILNEDRKQTVHYETITSRIQRDHRKGFKTIQEAEESQAWINSRIDYFIDQYHKCIEGLKQVTLFLESK